MKLYHKTFAADAILKDGFRDATGSYMTGRFWTGVWLSNPPLDANEGARGDVLLAIDIPEEAIRDYEWIEDDKPYREWLVPADLVNGYGQPLEVCELCAQFPVDVKHDCTQEWPALGS